MLMAGCRHESQMNLLSEAETFLPTAPDSADARLNLVKVNELQDDEEAAYYALLRTMTDAMQRKTPLNDTLAQRAYTFYSLKSNHGVSSDQILVKHYAQSALYMGECYAKSDSVKKSEDCYRQAIKGSEKCADWHTCYLSYERLAEQVHWSNCEEALTLIKKSIEIYKKCNDNIGNLLSLFHSLAHYTFQLAYTKESCFQDAIDLTQVEYDLAVTNGMQLYENQALNLFALIYWAQGDYQKALSYAKRIKLTELKNDYERAWNRTIAQCYLSCDSFTQAKTYLLRLKNISRKSEAYLFAKELAELAINNEESDSAICYMDSAFSSAEAMFFDALKAKDDYYQDNLEKEKNNEKLIYKDKLKTWLFGATILIILVGGILIVWVLVLRIRMHREQRRNSIIQMQLLQERQQALEESQQRKTATIRHLQRYIIDRTDVAMRLKDDTTRVRMSAKEWSDVERLLDEIDDRRISKIRARFKDLTVDDIRLCIMVRIGMSNPAIGNVYGITPSAVQHRKQTLKKKGFGVMDPDVTLDNYIETL